MNGGPANSGTVIKRERGGPWWHVCSKLLYNDLVPGNEAAVKLPGYWSRCPDCGAKRP